MNGHVEERYLHSAITDSIICCFYTVYNSLGSGFLEKVYENAMMLELEQRKLPSVSQHPIQVYYGDVVVGQYFADILVENKIIVEIKASNAISVDHEAQLLNYLKATDIEVGLLLNFGPKPEIKRKAFENGMKGICFKHV